MRRTIRLALATMICCVSAARLPAQSVNYADLEGVFGEPVTTSVTGTPQRASEAPASIVIITRAEIQNSPARSVPDLLKSYAGLDVNRWTAGQSDVAVRGGAQTYNARLLVLVNGRQVYLDHYGMTDWNLLGVQLEEIQQIELVRGPASALFGFNAASGVVNIVTVDPLVGTRAAITTEGGTHGYAQIAGMAALPIGAAVGLKISGSHRQEDERALPDTIYRPSRVDRVIADDLGARLSIAPGPATRIDLSGGWAGNRQLEFLPSQILAEQRFRSANAGVVVDHDTAWGSISGRAYTNWLNVTYGITTDPSEQLAVMDVNLRNRITVAQGTALIRLSDADTMRVAGEYRSNQLFSDHSFSHRIGYQVAAASGMFDVHPLDRVAVSLAARIDRLMLSQGGTPRQPAADLPSAYNRTITEPSFNAAVLVDVGQHGQLRLNGGRGLQAPSLVDFGTRISVPLPTSPIPFFIAGDPAILPTVVWSAEAGYGHRFTDMLRVDGSVFFTRTENAIASPGDAPIYSVIGTTLPVVVARFANVGAFESAGLELSASGRLAPDLSWLASYSWTRVRQDQPDTASAFAYAFSPRATTPAHVATAGVRYAHGRWFAALDGRYMSTTRQFTFDQSQRIALVRVPHALALDGKVGIHLTPCLTAYVAGENLGDASGAYGSPIPGDRRLRAGLSFGL